MAEYIDIDALVVVTDTRGAELETTVRHIFEMNKGVYTAADVIEVVRCKDCENYIDGRCYFHRGLNDLRSKEDYCSNGKRRIEGKHNG